MQRKLKRWPKRCSFSRISFFSLYPHIYGMNSKGYFGSETASSTFLPFNFFNYLLYQPQGFLWFCFKSTIQKLSCSNSANHGLTKGQLIFHFCFSFPSHFFFLLLFICSCFPFRVVHFGNGTVHVNIPKHALIPHWCYYLF